MTSHWLILQGKKLRSKVTAQQSFVSCLIVPLIEICHYGNTNHMFKLILYSLVSNFRNRKGLWNFYLNPKLESGVRASKDCELASFLLFYLEKLTVAERPVSNRPWICQTNIRLSLSRAHVKVHALHGLSETSQETAFIPLPKTSFIFISGKGWPHGWWSWKQVTSLHNWDLKDHKYSKLEQYD